MLNLIVSKEKMGEIFRLRRKEKGLRQQDVAEQAGVSISTVSNLELGNHTVKEESILACAQVLEVADDIFGLVSAAEKKEQEVKRELEKIEKITKANPDNALNQLENWNETFTFENNKNLYPFATYLWGRCYYEKRKWQQAEKFLQDTVQLIEEQLDQNEELRNSNLLAACYNSLGSLSFYENNFQRALEFTEKGLNSFVSYGEREYLYYFLLFNRSLFYQNVKNLEKTTESLEQLQEKITKFETEGKLLENIRLSVIIQYYDSFANVLNDMGMTKKALEYAQKGEKIAWLNQEYDALLTLWTTIGIIFANKEDPILAKEYLQLALHIQHKIKRGVLLIPVHTHLGQLYLKQNDSTTAIEHIKNALFISKKHNDIQGQIHAQQILGHCYLFEKQLDRAIQEFEKGYHLAKQHKMAEQELNLLFDLGNIYDQQGNREKFLSYIEQAYRTRNRQGR